MSDSQRKPSTNAARSGSLLVSRAVACNGKRTPVFFALICLCLFALPLQIFSSIRFNLRADLRSPFAARGSSSDIPTIYIVSHRRSGTHLTMDLLSHIIPGPFRLVKTNHVYLTESTDPIHRDAGLNCRCLNHMRTRGHIIHAYRDVRDVVTSMYYYYQTHDAGIMKNITKEEFFANKAGTRNRVIEIWVNTTVPWFMHDDVFQLHFSDSLSGYEHIYDKIAQFLGHPSARKLPRDPRKLVSTSGAVAKLAGRGEHGYKEEMTKAASDRILEVARAMHNSKRLETKICPPPSGFPDVLFLLRSFWIPGSGFWVGGDKKYGLFFPEYCPTVLKGSKVVIR